jgi:hypothetical protein
VGSPRRRQCILLQAARSVGSTLKAFQPTIREVVEVSQDIKGTLEKASGDTAAGVDGRLAHQGPGS